MISLSLAGAPQFHFALAPANYVAISASILPGSVLKENLPGGKRVLPSNMTVPESDLLEGLSLWVLEPQHTGLCSAILP